jgi:hypothetical protein
MPLLRDLHISFGVVTHLDIKQGRPLSIVELEFWEDAIIVMYHIFSNEY